MSWRIATRAANPTAFPTCPAKHQLLTRPSDNRAMFGPSMKTIFASRWKALWFFAVVMLTAYCSIPEAADTPGNDAAGQKQVEQVDSIIQHLKQSSDNLEQYKREHPE